MNATAMVKREDVVEAHTREFYSTCHNLNLIARGWRKTNAS